MRWMILVVLVLVGCDDSPTTPSLTPNQLYAEVCVERTIEYPVYNCAYPPIGVDTTLVATVWLTIDNPSN